MTPPTSLSGSHLQTYEAIFRHPAAHNLAWHDVRALFQELGHVAEEPNGNWKVTHNGETLVLRPSRTKDVTDISELLQLRHFLERSENARPVPAATNGLTVVVIDHHAARIFHSDAPGSVAQEILPHPPADHFRHAHNSKDFSRGQEKPDPNSFFEPVARALHDAARILVFGGGKGNASARELFVAWLARHHPALAGRIVGSLVLDEHHVTDAQLLAKAREFRGTPSAAVAGGK